MQTDVIVVGAGPTGLMLAHELSLAGVTVVVLEKERTRSTQSRAGGLQPRTAEVLDLRGLLEPLLADAPPQEGTGGHFAMLPVELDCRPWRTRYPRPVTLPQAQLEAFLEQRLRERGVPVLRGHAVTAVEQDPEGVSAGGIRGSYLVACDGAHSAVRRLLGVPFPGRTSGVSAVAADITLAARTDAVPGARRHFSEYVRASADFFGVLHPLDGDRYRLIFGKLSGDGPGREVPVAPEEIREVLHSLYGPGTELGELCAASRFGDATRQVERYREGRVLFAGDAAHIHMPIGGQGVNLGVQDAMNLGWKLAAAVRGWAPAGLLDSYHDERHPVAARVLQHTRAQTVLMNPGRNQDVAAVRDLMTELLRLPDTHRYISGMMSGLDIRYDGLGARMVDLDLTTEHGPTRMSELMHSGRGLLLSLDGKQRPVGGRSDRVDHITAKTADHVTAKTEEEGEALLIRPDGYVAWTAGDGTPLESALARWFG